MTTATDLFAGGGGSSTGAVMAGARVVWAANHSKLAVEYHKKNHPNTDHACQDLQQFDFSQVPDHDLMMASPCCQGHSNARGKNTPQHDASRSTAWAVVSAAEAKRPAFLVVENVPEFQRWPLFPMWAACLEKLGYSLAPHIIDAADLGVPQHRKRLFIIASRSRAPFELKLQMQAHRPASSVICWKEGDWQPVDIKGRSERILECIKNGRKEFGDQPFLVPYYGSQTNARSIDRPIGTQTTRPKFGIVKGDQMRMVNTKAEIKAIMGFSADYELPERQWDAQVLLGNAVCPPVMQAIVEQIGRVG